eukprot:CAMPEP_0118935418 /NCGR_PEP_ID=MMETSP1169-20130426/15632_1 /TAXON_ID=36882 /ORGANISM="Pyramimonas obovata, Strain CCMP722" /LENGTH=185 /DNA_ID=CAMNT_0006878457 /DNA_START=110 /DNA_END=667 /DNA_ORIENTATION=+
MLATSHYRSGPAIPTSTNRSNYIKCANTPSYKTRHMSSRSFRKAARVFAYADGAKHRRCYVTQRDRNHRRWMIRAHPNVNLAQEEGLMEWDVVAYPVDSLKKWDATRVGLVITVKDNACQVQPLYQEKESGLWLEEHDTDLQTVPTSEVRILLNDFSQRMDPDRVSNPHGEHAQNVWDILEEPEL